MSLAISPTETRTLKHLIKKGTLSRHATVYVHEKDQQMEPLYDLRAQHRTFDHGPLSQNYSLKRTIRETLRIEKPLSRSNVPRQYQHSRTKKNSYNSNSLIMKLHLQYFAALREDRGLAEETIETNLKTPKELYLNLKQNMVLS